LGNADRLQVHTLGRLRSGQLEMSNASSLEQLKVAEALRLYAGLAGEP